MNTEELVKGIADAVLNAYSRGREYGGQQVWSLSREVERLEAQLKAAEARTEDSFSEFIEIFEKRGEDGEDTVSMLRTLHDRIIGPSGFR